MSKPLLLRLHRWLTLAFAIPLALVILTGLILSFEPIVRVSAIQLGSLSTERVVALLERHDPEAKAQSLSWHPYENRLSIGAPRRPPIDVDVRSGEVITNTGIVSGVFFYARVIHENIVPGFGWLVQLSTAALVVLIVIGLLLGWPKLANSISGWHKGVAWVGLPLFILSPLTGLFLAWGISFTGPASAPRPALPLVDAVRQIGASHDLSNLVWLRSRGGRQLARIVEDGEYQIHVVSREGVMLTPRNWVRIFHEGNFAGIWSGIMNIVVSLAFIGLMTTGLILWARRRAKMARPNGGRGKLAAARAAQKASLGVG